MDQLADTKDLNSILEKAPGNTLIWNRFLEELIQQLNCDSSALLVTDLLKRENTHFLFSANISQAYQQQYENGLNKQDSFNEYIGKNPKRIFCSQSLKKDFPKELVSHFKPPSGQNFCCGVSIPCNQNHVLNLLITRHKEFNDNEIQQITRTLQSIISPLEQALYSEQRYKINSQLLHSLGNHFDGYIIVDKQLNILFSDPVYTSIISQLDCVEISGNQLSMTNPTIKQQLLTLITDNNASGSIHNQCLSCQLTLIPISALENLYKWECYKDGFILTFTHDKNKNPTLNRLTDIYQLSRCEAVCALHFMNTPSILDIASKTHRSQETVRNHIKHTMQKMDVHNQAELMKKLITLAAL